MASDANAHREAALNVIALVHAYDTNDADACASLLWSLDPIEVQLTLAAACTDLHAIWSHHAQLEGISLAEFIDRIRQSVETT